MYLLYLDESGTHGGSPTFVLSGLAVHEQDAWHLQQKLDGVVRRRLPAGFNHLDFELHAAEIKSPVKRVRGRIVRSIWANLAMPARFDLMRATFRAIGRYTCRDPQHPYALFGAAVATSYPDHEERAYEEVLHKFDEMLNRLGHASGGVHQRGVVIHDRRLIMERDVQAWADTWRRVTGRIGRLHHIADVPFFADSKASRLIQAADFVSWGLFRYYGPLADESWIRPLWSNFDSADGVMHGLIHVFPGYRGGSCGCPPCQSRRTA